jgi:hypothetical protein
LHTVFEKEKKSHAVDVCDLSWLVGAISVCFCCSKPASWCSPACSVYYNHPFIFLFHESQKSMYRNVILIWKPVM